MALKFFNTSSNPILKDSLLEQVQGVSGVTMTSSGAVNKSIILGLILLATAIVSWMFPSTMFLWPSYYRICFSAYGKFQKRMVWYYSTYICSN